MNWVFLNGRFAASVIASVPALDRGVLYGYGLFETMRAHYGRIFRLEDHYRRLSEGTAALGIALPLTLAELRLAISGLVKRNNLEDARLRLTVTAGATTETGATEPAVLLSAATIGDYPTQGMTAIVSHIRRNEMSPLCRLKSLNYLDSVLAREEAHRGGADEAILLNTKGMMAEGSMSNVFFVADGRLLTPAIEAGALPGITRAVALELARAAGIECDEVERPIEALTGADEAFLTNAVMGITPLTTLDGQPVGADEPGEVTLTVQRLYQEAVARETSASQ